MTRVRCSTRAFTLVEVMASLIVLTLGLLAAIGLVVYGMRLAQIAFARTTGMETAVSIAVDPAPLLPTGTIWTTTGTMGSSHSEGFVNGFWVQRDETDPRAIGQGLLSVAVQVDVFEVLHGRLLASFGTRLMRKSS